MDQKGKKILIVDDEPDIREIIAYNLTREGYEIHTAKDGIDALDKAQAHIPDLVILDINMPNMNGVEVCRILRSQEKFHNTLIIFLTAMSDENTQIIGFETGADGYVNKPVSPKVLVSRVNALFRRTKKDDEKSIKIGNMEIDPVKFLVILDGIEISLAKKEFELLFLLASQPGRVFLRNEILSKVWGTEVIVGDRTIDVHIRKIRQKLGLDCVKTVKGVGYKFDL